MPTLADIANEVNNELSQIESHTKDTSDTVALIKGDTADIKSRLDAVRGTLDAGFAFLGEGLYALLETQRQANAHLASQVDQHDVMLCWLSTMAELLCRQLRTIEADLAVHEDVLAALRTLEGVLGLVHARELVETQQRAALQAKLADCCPPRSTPDRACYEPCREPEVTSHEPQGQDWDGRWDPHRPEG